MVETITQLGVGEALVTTLQEGGVPLPVERTYMVPPRSRIGTITPEERAVVRNRSPVGAKYDTTLNRESAHERLTQRAEHDAAPTKDSARAPTAEQPVPATEGGFAQKLKDWMFGTKRRQGAVEAMAKSTMRTVGNRIGREILRGVLGGVSRRR